MKIIILLVSSAVALIMLMASLAPADSAPADATFAVNDQSDAVDNNIGDGVCLAANGKWISADHPTGCVPGTRAIGPSG